MFLRVDRFHDLVKSILPVTAIVQLNAAYVPVIRLPLTVAVTSKGHERGLLGVSLAERDDPVSVPLAVPPLLFAGSEKVDAQVPEIVEPDCEIVIRIVPIPARLSVEVPVHVPARDGLGEVGLSPSQAATIARPIKSTTARADLVSAALRRAVPTILLLDSRGRRTKPSTSTPSHRVLQCR